ncbi:hypothetical protein [Streptomyces sp. AM 2-1-1]|uniref:hypothetical protein n=1 Tax=Streptomyces sp. AM 2-1-1 TaxID=3028709 RepID=UPI0023B98960|nr:hypothetical protein [Streptomyces sp. AM 2-1-1]WEH40806.1 hypothetical protein PZB77_15550 [Streptomyces sp. AM 2-1-1]
MPITLPKYPATNDELLIRVSSLDADVQLTYTVRPDQIDTWTDQDLLDKVAALRAAVRGLLPERVDLQVNIFWNRSGQTSVLHDVETTTAAS